MKTDPKNNNSNNLNYDILKDFEQIKELFEKEPEIISYCLYIKFSGSTNDRESSFVSCKSYNIEELVGKLSIIKARLISISLNDDENDPNSHDLVKMDEDVNNLLDKLKKGKDPLQ